MSGRKPSVPVRCDQTGEIFASLREASREKKLLITELRMHVKDRKSFPEVGGFTFTKIQP